MQCLPLGIQCLLISCLVFVFVFKTPALAAPPVSEAQFAQGVQEMVSSYEAGEWRKTLQKARTLVSPAFSQYRPATRARYYLYVGLALARQELPSTAWQSFLQALLLDSSLRLPSGESAALQQSFASARKQALARQKELRYLGGRSASSGGGARWQNFLAWTLAIVAVGALAVGTSAGVNALTDAGHASELLKNASRRGLSEPSVAPSIEALHRQASSQALIANIFYIVGGVLAAGAATFFLLDALGSSSAKPVAHLSPFPLQPSPRQNVVLFPLRQDVALFQTP